MRVLAMNALAGGAELFSPLGLEKGVWQSLRDVLELEWKTTLFLWCITVNREETRAECPHNPRWDLYTP